ncbi:hypothetical protein JI666_20630 [Bacillus sp. NTK071]|uniref:TIGR04104 family putative zinc finger protein n=1 Tax=Bacillus sp. NTK071 TaxID=2802175 RepID=UPI001A8EC2D4|nr:TIGR04104 family putative zinc finger protein [Bacillus sp. NTK071]MBN8211128.1 hypothetical protein [Bacillus sp. NTK071]
MTTCCTCHSKWTWKETFFTMFTIRKAVSCPTCGNEQYVTRRSRNNLSLIPSIVALFWLPLIAFGLPFSLILSIEVFISILTLLSLPFFYEVTDQDEPMW